MTETRTRRGGRPRSEQAREAVLHAVDDLLLEVGYAAMTMKGIAQRAGVGRQTVYRWWSTKAEILLEASSVDAREELAITPTGELTGDLSRYLQALTAFLTRSAAGSAYRALLGEAQHDQRVAELIARQDVIAETARAVLAQAMSDSSNPPSADALDRAVPLLVGPTLYWLISGHDATRLDHTASIDAALSNHPVAAADRSTRRPAGV